LGQAAAVVEERAALVGECQAVRRAVQQTSAATLLDARQRPRDLTDGDVALARRSRQRAEGGNAREELQIVKGQAVHQWMVGGPPLRGTQRRFEGPAVSAPRRRSYSGLARPEGARHEPRTASL